MGRDRGGARRAVTAFFDHRAAAQHAVDDLAAAGVGRDRITLVDGRSGVQASRPVPTAHQGLWDAVKNLFMADEDRHAYGEGLMRGGIVLSVMVSGDDDRIVEILDREGAVDMDARQSDWELEGWKPDRAAADLRDAGAAVAAPPTAPSLPAEAAAADRPVVRDFEAEGLRLRTYVESRDHPDPLR